MTHWDEQNVAGHELWSSYRRIPHNLEWVYSCVKSAMVMEADTKVESFREIYSFLLGLVSEESL